MAELQAEAQRPWLKLALDLGPLILFFAVNARWGIFAATAVFMLTVIAALAASRAVFGRLPAVPLVTAAFVLAFGGPPAATMRCSMPHWRNTSRVRA